jgi:hypothetical protein
MPRRRPRRAPERPPMPRRRPRRAPERPPMPVRRRPHRRDQASDACPEPTPPPRPGLRCLPGAEPAVATRPPMPARRRRACRGHASDASSGLLGPRPEGLRRLRADLGVLREGPRWGHVASEVLRDPGRRLSACPHRMPRAPRRPCRWRGGTPRAAARTREPSPSPRRRPSPEPPQYPSIRRAPRDVADADADGPEAPPEHESEPVDATPPVAGATPISIHPPRSPDPRQPQGPTTNTRQLRRQRRRRPRGVRGRADSSRSEGASRASGSVENRTPKGPRAESRATALPPPSSKSPDEAGPTATATVTAPCLCQNTTASPSTRRRPPPEPPPYPPIRRAPTSASPNAPRPAHGSPDASEGAGPEALGGGCPSRVATGERRTVHRSPAGGAPPMGSRSGGLTRSVSEEARAQRSAPRAGPSPNRTPEGPRAERPHPRRRRRSRAAPPPRRSSRRSSPPRASARTRKRARRRSAARRRSLPHIHPSAAPQTSASPKA